MTAKHGCVMNISARRKEKEGYFEKHIKSKNEAWPSIWNDYM